MVARKTNRKFVIIIILVLAIIFAGSYFAYKTIKNKPTTETQLSSEANVQQPTTSPQISQRSFDRNKYSTTDPASVWFIVNKNSKLESTYQPAELTVPNVPLQAGKTSQEMSVRRDAATELEKMFAAAKEQGVQLKLASGYRSYDLQEYYYNSLVRSLGAEEANKVSAKPGTSEHQTGLAADIASYSNDVCHLETCFGTMSEGQWLANNAHTYGFIIRYPQSKTAITGYNYEPWHVRYVGKELASELQKTGQTLEEFFSTQ